MVRNAVVFLDTYKRSNNSQYGSAERRRTDMSAWDEVLASRAVLFDWERLESCVNLNVPLIRQVYVSGVGDHGAHVPDRVLRRRQQDHADSDGAQLHVPVGGQRVLLCRYILLH